MVFYKMHGLSNDYIFMDCFKQPVEEPKELAKKLSLRHTSVGADGLILICPSFVADCKMVMYNADGSEGKMCGNGIRCVGKYVYEKGIVTKKNISVETASGIKHIYLTVSGGKVILVKVDLGIPEFFPAKIPIIDELEEDSFIRRRIMIPSGEEINAGATAIIISESEKLKVIHKVNQLIAKQGILNKSFTIIAVDNTRRVLSLIAQQFYKRPAGRLILIGITGTKGKTTTSWYLREILMHAGFGVGVIGTLGVYINDAYYETKNTTPESIDIQKYLFKMVEQGVTYVIIEVSSQALKYDRIFGMRLSYGIFTNISHDHIGINEHKDMNEYMYCKSLLFKQCEIGVFNLDDERFDQIKRGAECIITTFGIANKSMLSAYNIRYIKDTMQVKFDTKGIIRNTFTINAIGLVNVYNALAAIIIAVFENIEYKYISRAMLTVNVAGRGECINIPEAIGGGRIIIDYAHNAESMRQMFEEAKRYCDGRIISVFGCGGNRSVVRRYEMGEISGEYADITVVTDDNPRDEDNLSIINDICKGIKKTDGSYVIIPDRREAISHAISITDKNSVILLLGKGHENYQEIKGIRTPFDERLIIDEIIKEKQNK